VPYVINDLCVGAKHATCIDVCPVDCIHPRPEDPRFEDAAQLYIDPEECIDCHACFVVCPVEAITPESSVPSQWVESIERNAAYFA